MPTVRTIMLEGTHIAEVVACNDEGWNGFHVPLMTAQAFNNYMQACQENDPNGEYWEHAFVEGDTLRLPFWEAPEDREQDMVWPKVGHDTMGHDVYAIDGMVWVDFEEDE